VTRPREFSTAVWDLLSRYQSEGLVERDWEPLGDTDREHRSSIESKAYMTWLDRNQEACSCRHPETCRSMFQNRHNPNWSPPERVPVVEIVARAPALPEVQGFDRPSPSLPIGDLWQEYEPQPAEEDIPPPAEVA